MPFFATALCRPTALRVAMPARMQSVSGAAWAGAAARAAAPAAAARAAATRVRVLLMGFLLWSG